MHRNLNTIPLRPGDTIGIVAPAGQLVDHDQFSTGINILSEMGFKTKFPRNLWPGTGYLADTDENRALEFNLLWRDKEVKALLALRGGFGSLRILENIDLKSILRAPKPFIGYSDITVLNNYIASQTGIVTLHGPVLTSLADCSNGARERFYSCLIGNWKRQIPLNNIEILRGGDDIRGSLVGGNLSSLITTLGTPYDSSWEGRIVLLEDTNEPLYSIDRMLTHLYYAGKFSGVSAILLGDFSHRNHVDSIDKIRHHEWVWQRVLELTMDQKTIVWGNFPIGHCPENFTLPLGAEAFLNSRQAKLHFL